MKSNFFLIFMSYHFCTDTNISVVNFIIKRLFLLQRDSVLFVHKFCMAKFQSLSLYFKSHVSLYSWYNVC